MLCLVLNKFILSPFVLELQAAAISKGTAMQASTSSTSWASWWAFPDLILVLRILLLMAGDVELNPGPLGYRPSPVSHQELYALAEQVSHEYYTKLGLCLGCNNATLSNIRRDNPRTEDATYAALCAWLKDPPEHESRQILVRALTECGLRHLAPSIEQGTICSRNPGIQDMTEEQIEQCRNDLMEELAVMFCQVQTKPLDPDSLLELNDIYTNLILLGEDIKSKSPQLPEPLKYEDILNDKVNNVPLRRVLVQGEAGVGKTTFLCKIIHDWIKGTHFQNFKMVLPVRLREVKDGKTIGEIVKSYLLDDNEVTADQLNTYIRKNQDKVLILLDGYDELADQCSDSILKVLMCEEYKKCFVIITSRPWKAIHIRNDTELRKRYAFVEIKGFTTENVKEFVTRFFGNEKEPAESLVKFMEKGSLIAENMSPYPIFCAMLCNLWKEEARREVVQRLQTFSQLFQEIMQFMEDSYLEKHCRSRNLRSGSTYEDTKTALDYNLLQIAEVAFEGLMVNNLVFPEDRFGTEVLQAGYDFGIISKDKKRSGRSERKKLCMTGKVCFPHKLFQEFLAGLHLARQAKANEGRYLTLLHQVLSKNREEMNFLLFFAAAQEKKVALDITSGLVKKMEEALVRSTTGVEAAALKLIVDVVFESFNEDVAREVERHFCSLSRMTKLEVDNVMSAHTVAGYFYTFANLESVVFLDRSYGHTLSSDLADKVCTLSSLRRVELKRASFPEVFYKHFSKEAAVSRVHSFKISGVILESSTSSSSCLAEGLCVMPDLDTLTLQNASLEPDFYSMLAGCALYAQIKDLHLADMSLESEEPISKNLARAVCSMPSLKKLTLSDLISLHDVFYARLADNASSIQIEVLELSNLELITVKPSQNLAECVSAMPCLQSLVVVKKTSLHPEFFSRMAASSQENNQDENQSAKSQMGLTLTLDHKTVDDWCRHELHSTIPNLTTFALRCGKDIDLPTLKKMPLPGLQELHIEAALPARDPKVPNADNFCRTIMTSFPGLKILVLTHVSLGNQMSKVIIEQVKEHSSIQDIRLHECHTDVQMDTWCERINSEGKISVSMKHGDVKMKSMARILESRLTLGLAWICGLAVAC